MTQQNDRGGWWDRLRAKLNGGSTVDPEGNAARPRGEGPRDDTGGTDGGADKAEARRKLEEWAASCERPAWRPVVADDGESTAISRFGGAPWLPDGESVPRCETCGRELQLFVQLELSSLPAGNSTAKREGVLQLFYCRGGTGSGKHDECWGEGGWEPFSTEVKLARVVPETGLGQVSPDSGGEPPWPAKVIASWERFVDRPHPEDHAAAGLRTTYDFQSRTVLLEVDVVGVAERFGIDELPVEQIAMAVEGDKLAGWPCWIQGAEYPCCSVCGDTMEVIFQVDSVDHVPYMFGDAGIGHISICNSHPDVVAFGWACG
ncbi:MAG: DUF1963 domain-containing protein [Actinomycetia bacterium]|nr:DUF1963 domain-containing protein [Actinomycetes bacterium]